ncbi:MAG: histidinol dehydrogenase [Chloroflexota bacterium]|nr:histidinol dehydrogenase [Chloroflexota bacterium]
MIRVEGFGKARGLLDRRRHSDSFSASLHLPKHKERTYVGGAPVGEVVESIIEDVCKRGDEALFYYANKLDGVDINSLEVGRVEITAACDAVDETLVASLKLAASRIRDFHLACKCEEGIIFVNQHLGRKVQPLDRVGLYVPGGTAAYPSTLLMTAIPARVAGVREIIVTSPPAKNGSIPPSVLVAADIAGVERIFKIGGAQAIAALAFGTETVPKVDKICGPGNIYVTLAKKLVYGAVAIDGLEGPSEVIVVADRTSNPVLCAADLLAQAEHDALASAILISTSTELADRVDEEIELQLPELKRRSTVREAIRKGMIVTVDNIDEALDLVNLYAPEHLSLMVADAASLIPRIHNAGCIFVGETSPVVLGDYIDGPSHVLPTGGSARFNSPLGVEDFLKFSNICALDRATMRELSKAAITMARAEGLDAHARALEKRIETGGK